MSSPAYQIVTYDPRHQPAFRALNLEWIERYFRVESKDMEQVDNPQACLDGGGQIFFALDPGGVAVGTCAMYKIGERRFELAKMAVDPKMRGQGLGDALMRAAEAWAVAMGADEIMMLSNTVLEPAIQLYKKHGYRVIHLGPHPMYERCNIELAKKLT